MNSTEFAIIEALSSPKDELINIMDLRNIEISKQKFYVFFFKYFIIIYYLII